MRLDKFLYFVRLTKTRSIAQVIVHGGTVRVDGRVISSAHAKIGLGNVITFPLYDKIRVIRIEALPSRRGPPAEAQACYSEVAITPIDASQARL